MRPNSAPKGSRGRGAAQNYRLGCGPRVFGSADAKEGATAFIGRHDPVWTAASGWKCGGPGRVCLSAGGWADDTIIRGGENIAPAEIEAVLLTHDEVVDAVAVGMPEEEWGQRIEAAVVLRAGARTDPDQLREFVRARLRASKAPDPISAWDELPPHRDRKAGPPDCNLEDSGRSRPGCRWHAVTPPTGQASDTSGSGWRLTSAVPASRTGRRCRAARAEWDSSHSALHPAPPENSMPRTDAVLRSMMYILDR